MVFRLLLTTGEVLEQADSSNIVAETFNMKDKTRILELATQILHATAKVNDYLISLDLPQPSFGIDGPTTLSLESPEAEEARMNAIAASVELGDLLQGPVSCLRPAINASSLEAIYRWNIPSKVPLNGSEISFTALAKECDMYEPNLRRILRYAILYHRVFQEPRAGFVTHSAASLLLAKDPAMFDALGLMFDESWQAFARVSPNCFSSPRFQADGICFLKTQTCDALQTLDGQEPNETVRPTNGMTFRSC